MGNPNTVQTFLLLPHDQTRFPKPAADYYAANPAVRSPCCSLSWGKRQVGNVGKKNGQRGIMSMNKKRKVCSYMYKEEWNKVNVEN
jgi:hypothetical protein